MGKVIVVVLCLGLLGVAHAASSIGETAEKSATATKEQEAKNGKGPAVLQSLRQSWKYEMSSANKQQGEER